jgi:N6-L-threonylcarbamoyladenine synthase
MYALGIETSCDETSVAVVKQRTVLANVTVSSLDLHKKYGGIIPEIATRNHLQFIDSVTKKALIQAGIGWDKIKIIGVTYRPGLIGSLLVGLNFAKALSLASAKPFLAINHLQAHVFAPFLDNNQPFPFPFLGLIVSGGHTQLVLVKDFDNIEKVASTRDDAAGEVFDKVARAFGLGYPGGVYIDKVFNEQYKDSFQFKCGTIDLDFSFSGIKTAVTYKKRELEKKSVLTEELKNKLLSSFQESVVQRISKNTFAAADRFKVTAIAAGGGVIANKRLRQLLSARAEAVKIPLLMSPLKYSSDNAAMVAGLAFYLYNEKGKVSDFEVQALSR